MITQDKQVRKLVEEYSKEKHIGKASLKSGMCRKTGSKYLKLCKMPSEMKKPHTWRTRKDPFEEVWPEIDARLKDAPELEAKALFEKLLRDNPDVYHEGQLRTFQRRVRQWRGMSGPPKEVVFTQEHRPGEAMQTDFTRVKKQDFEITIGGEPFEHMLCHVVLPYSNWEYVTVSRSESMAAIKRGVQAAIFKLGKVPEYHQTDNSTSATHDLGGGKREFNKEYEEFMAHFDMKPRTIAVGASNQNGDIEAMNGVLKRRLKQHLLLRGSHDFVSLEEYERWIQDVAMQGNALRSKKVKKELGSMRAVKVSKLPEYKEIEVRVTSRSTVRVQFNTYSVPSRLIGEIVRVRVYEDRVEVYYNGKEQMRVERLLGRHGHHIEYRHVIDSLIRKPGAFARYKFREDLFPGVTFRRAYDSLSQAIDREIKADLEYIRILHLAARTMESEVESAIELLLDDRRVPFADDVKALVEPLKPQIPAMAVLHPDLRSYDALLTAGVKGAA